MNNTKVTIAIDTKKYGIRIHKPLYRELGEPRNILFLVDPLGKYIAIQTASNDYSGGCTHRITEKRMYSEHSYEVYSHKFISKLLELSPEIKNDHTYRLTGSVISAKKVAVFSLNTLQRID